MDKYPSFDKKNGTFVRNFYCMECMCGPFVQEDIDKNLMIQMGGQRHTLAYCRKCFILKFPQFANKVRELSEKEKERERYIVSGEAMNDLRNNAKTKYIPIPIKKEDRIVEKKVVPPILALESYPEKELIANLIQDSDDIEDFPKQEIDAIEQTDTPVKKSS